MKHMFFLNVIRYTDHFQKCQFSQSVADLRGGAPGTRHAPPPLCQKFLHFHAVFRKTPLGLAHPPLGNPGSATVSAYLILYFSSKTEIWKMPQKYIAKY